MAGLKENSMTDSNVTNQKPLLERFPGTRPTPQQAVWQDRELGMFIHFGLYAVTGRFTGITWGNNLNPLYSNSLDPVSPAIFNPVNFDAKSWVEAAQSGGAKYLLFTAKHHEGFCLWPTAVGEHNIKHSPWRNGQGDLVGELSAACRDAGLPFGIYLSPWDAYAYHTLKLSDKEYDQYYMRQLTELLTGYGKIVEVWWDGAGSRHRRHDWRSYYHLIKSLQPDAVIMGTGCSDVRWLWEVPEEQGLGLDTNWYVVHVPELTPEEPVRPGGFLWPADQRGGDYWWPGESYLAMDRFWSGATNLPFGHGRDTAHSTEEIVEAYHRTVGRGYNLVVNFVPQPNGNLAPIEVERFARAGKILRRAYAENLISGGHAIAGCAVPGHEPQHAIDGKPDTWWQGTIGVSAPWVEVDLGRSVTFDRAVVQEAIVTGQAVEAYRLLWWDGKQWRKACEGTTIGHKRIDIFSPVTASRIRLDLTATRGTATVRNLGLYLGDSA